MRKCFDAIRRSREPGKYPALGVGKSTSGPGQRELKYTLGWPESIGQA
jgi:hypothetical protein